MSWRRSRAPGSSLVSGDSVGITSQPKVRGTLLAIGGVLILSPDTLLIRLAGLDQWTAIFGRSVFAAIGLFIAVTMMSRHQERSTTDLFRSVGRAGLLVVCLSASANLLFVVSVTQTFVANTLVIFSASPLFASAMSHFIIKERVSTATWYASFGALAAITVVLMTSTSGSGLIGNLAALAATLLLAANLTVIRVSRATNLVPALVGASLLSALLVVGFIDLSSVTPAALGYLILDGLVIIPLSLSLIMVAPRYIPAPDVALYHLLETVLGPMWVWVALGETPPALTILSGVILLSVLASYFLTQMSRTRVKHSR